MLKPRLLTCSCTSSARVNSGHGRFSSMPCEIHLNDLPGNNLPALIMGSQYCLWLQLAACWSSHSAGCTKVSPSTGGLGAGAKEPVSLPLAWATSNCTTSSSVLTPELPFFLIWTNLVSGPSQGGNTHCFKRLSFLPWTMIAEMA